MKDVVLTHDKDECLIWPHTTNSKGLGTITISGKKHTVNRLVCEQEHGPPPSKRHKAVKSCRTPLCVARKHWSWSVAPGSGYKNETSA